MESALVEVPLLTVPPGYAEHRPPPELGPFVECFWTRLDEGGETAPAPAVHRVLPDGSTDIVFTWSGEGAVSEGDVSGAVVVGAMTRPLVFNGHGARLYAGVRFRPGRAFGALGIPAEELTDQSVPLGVFSARAVPDVERVISRPTNEERLAALVSLVRRRLIGAPPPPASVRAAVRRISLASGNLRVAALAEEIGVSRQHLARQFAVHAGVTPKTLARVMRVRAAIARAGAPGQPRAESVDWSEIAYELGYYDQPHFIDDFKSIAGLTPGEWITTPR